MTQLLGDLAHWLELHPYAFVAGLVFGVLLCVVLDLGLRRLDTGEEHERAMRQVRRTMKRLS